MQLLRAAVRDALLCVVIAFGSTPALAEAGSATAWKAFRSLHPFHAQLIALSEISDSGERTLIISEPPPLFYELGPETVIRNALGGNVKDIEVHRQPMGADGWLEDFAVTLQPAPDASLETESLRGPLADLSFGIFGTTYGANVQAIAERPFEEAPTLDFRIDPAELRQWLIVDNTPLVDADSEIETTLTAIFSAGSSGLYRSTNNSLVVLVLDRSAAVPSLDVLRQFAIDSDLVLGGVADGDDQVAIVARGRILSTDTLPPLRAETIQRLLSLTPGDLRQSYERNHPFAGKLTTGKDWAPILLSDELVNTEFGSLLNLTDQLLKSWSEAGQVDYVNFPYPKPAEFPFGDKALSKYLNSERTLFNWNTSGFGNVFQFDDVAVYSIGRTGSLPITYGSDIFTGERDSSIADAEDVAWNYFAGRSDPNLVRVVQYTAIYQLSQAFPLKNAATAPRYGDADALLPLLRQQSTKDLAAIFNGTAVFLPSAKEILRQEVELEFPGSLPDETDAIVDMMMKSILASAPTPGSIVDDRLAAELETAMIEVIANPRGSLPSENAYTTLEGAIGSLGFDAQPEDLTDQLVEIAQPEREEVLRALASTLAPRLEEVMALTVDKDGVYDAAIEAAKASLQVGSIRTASVVLSWGTEVEAVGGHSLDASRDTVALSTGVAPGTFTVTELPDGRTQILVNPADQAKVGELPRIVERTKSDLAKRQQLMEDALGRDATLRPVETALGLDAQPADARPRAAAGIYEDGLGPREVARGSTVPAEYREIASTQSADYVVDYSIVSKPKVCECGTPPGVVFEVNGMMGVIEMFAGSPGARIAMKNATPYEAQGLIEGIATLADGGFLPPVGGKPKEVADLPPERGDLLLVPGKKGKHTSLRSLSNVSLTEMFAKISAKQPDFSKAEITSAEVQLNNGQRQVVVVVDVPSKLSLADRLIVTVKKLIGLEIKDQDAIATAKAITTVTMQQLALKDAYVEYFADHKQQFEDAFRAEGYTASFKGKDFDLIMAEIALSRWIDAQS